MFKTLLFAFLLLTLKLYAQIPEYYSGIDFNQSPDNIKSQLSLLITQTHLVHLSYTPGTWIALEEMDLNPNNPENVLLVYGSNDNDQSSINDRSRDKDLSCHTTECTNLWSREHIFPKSIGNYDTDSWPGTDVHALRPSDGDMNEYRFNFPYANSTGSAHLVTTSSFYPGDEWKGDVARMIMYMALRYPMNCDANQVAVSNNTYNSNMPDRLLQWNAEDPVSFFEMNRNNLIEADFQGNRNPFIDNPYLATLLWGGPAAENTWEEMLNTQDILVAEFQVYPKPTKDQIHYEIEDLKSVKIYNSLGQFVSQDLDLNDKTTVLPSKVGIYWVEVCTDSNCKSFKIIKN